MDYLIYKSTALVAPDSAACRDIVTVSQRNNAGFGLTGFLHAEPGLFIQYLEGPAKPLWALYERLHLDPRHRDLRLLGRGHLDRRRFVDWRMGYSDEQVLSFADFKAQVSVPGPAADAPRDEAIYFLKVACARIDIGIVEAPLVAPDL
ncbi:BLUF domain-containing protein [Jannaschia ovalis]|uniref:BLUF domain-containing protein n=1 Tax=Jannaschia ovalis TaxID=3038773 RepID=A0ABY8LE46_9RHOB|nr:BLUF domain-containing protein [Jannaschia sp. GRR-S6-38]WGH79587.1 BLUF domain-containing protein [Jannaschia sp. GRR-S6-38]